MVEELSPGAERLEFAGHVTRAAGSLEATLPACDVIVEAAGIEAVQEYGPRIVGAGRDLVVASIGAFADPRLLPALRAAGTGRVHLTSGAIGGLDLLAAAGRTGGLVAARVRSTKLPTSLIQPWMSAAERGHLSALSRPELLFSGTPELAIAQFPASLNVAVAVQLAVGPRPPITVELVADPEAHLTHHEITASGPAGDYAFSIRNAPLAARRASSGLTARALAADLLRLAEERR
nr:aspartate dehydrogenase domain-containing protein [Leucobacter luti]